MMKQVKKGGVKTMSMKAEGIWWDKVYKKNKDGQVYLAEETPKRHNLLTEPYTKLVASFFAGGSLNGIEQHAIGIGETAWDTSTPPATGLETTLFDEKHRQAPDGITFIKFGKGTAESGTIDTIVDSLRLLDGVSVGRFEPDDFFNGLTVDITAGTNNGESRTVSDYDQATGTITVSSSFTAPIDNTSVYEFQPVVSVSETNTIEVKTTLPFGIPADPFNGIDIREQGLFGGDATTTLDSGFMIDNIRHAKIFKDDSIQLIRFIRLSFRI